MSREIDEATWRNRFIMIQMSRIGFTIMVFLGLVIWQTDKIVEGGSIIGFPIALIGVIGSFLAPKWLARKWRTPPAP
ncbi:MAG TPA: hypothetical protein VGD10_08670 [Allosphingosinicella sp.]|uniref:hypothetical protein n=1 Tax=Allosphingosinicella sp. TaxID=2823234 RepID=UPI002ED91C9C